MEDLLRGIEFLFQMVQCDSTPMLNLLGKQMTIGNIWAKFLFNFPKFFSMAFMNIFRILELQFVHFVFKIQCKHLFQSSIQFKS